MGNPSPNMPGGFASSFGNQGLANMSQQGLQYYANISQQQWQQMLGQPLSGSGGGNGGAGTAWTPGMGGAGGGGSGASTPSFGGNWSATTPQYSLRRSLKHLPNTLGWRYWSMAPDGCLISPQYGTRWEGAELRTPEWCESDVVRGVAGIHALLAPEHWKLLQFPYGDCLITGLVERFGRFVLGEDGWRAEWVVIKEVLVQGKKIADKLRAFYPDLVIHIDEPEEQDDGHRKGDRDRSTGVTTVQPSANHGSVTVSNAYGLTVPVGPGTIIVTVGAGGGSGGDTENNRVKRDSWLKRYLRHRQDTVTVEWIWARSRRDRIEFVVWCCACVVPGIMLGLLVGDLFR